MTNAQAYWWGFWSFCIVVMLITCVSGNVVLDGINLAAGWHRWAIGASCVLWLAVIIHSVFCGGAR